MAINRTIRAKITRSTMRAGIITPTIAFAMHHGLTIEELATLTGCKWQDFMSPEARIPEETMPLILQELSRRFPDKVLSLEMAKAAPFASLGGLADGAQYASTLREALELIVENNQFVADQLETNLEILDDEARWVIRHPLQEIDRGRTNEFALAQVHRLIVDLLGIEGALKRVELCHGPYGPANSHTDFFDAPVKFDCPQYAIVLYRYRLDDQVSQANSQLFGYMRLYLEQVRASIKTSTLPEALKPLVDAIIENAESGVFSRQAAAFSAGLSLRQAQRLASSNGTTLNELISNVRMDIARELLADSTDSVSKISMILGYSDDRAFRRAFKRAEGKSPTQFRITEVGK